jgi:hypothetical protein
MISGKYVYYLNGEFTGVTETFRVERFGSGNTSTVKTTANRDALVFGTKIDVTTIEINNRFERIEITMRSGVETRAEFEFSSDEFVFRRFRDTTLIDNDVLPLETGTIIFPLMRVFQGKTILSVAANGAETNIMVPFVEAPSDLERLLKPTYDRRTASLIAEENQIRKYKYLSKHYDEDSEFHIDASDLLSYYRYLQTADKLWEVRLEMSEPVV